MKIRSIGSYVLSIFLLFMSLGYMYLCFQYFKSAQNSIKWLTTIGEIVSNKNMRNAGYTKNIDINKKYYRYKTNNKTFYSNIISFSPFLIQESNTLKFGEKVKVYYNPINPKNSTISTKINIKQFCLAILITLVGVFYSICLLGYGLQIDIKNNIARNVKINVSQEIYRCVAVVTVILLIEVAPILIAIALNIDTRKDKDQWFMIVYLIVIMWLLLQTVTAFYLMSDVLCKYKKTPKKTKANIKMIIGAGSFIYLSVISVIIWFLWLIS